MGTSRYIRHIVSTLYIQLLTAVPTSMVPYATPYHTAQCTAYVVRSFFYFFPNNKYLTQSRELCSKSILINGSLGSRKGSFLRFNLYMKCLKTDLVQSVYQLPHLSACVK